MTDHLPPPEVSRLAAQAFTARQAAARRRFAQGEIALDTAVAHLRPWLAVACLLGADLPELDEMLADRRVFNVDGTAALTEGELRWLAADDICPRARWQPMLAKARDRAVDRSASGQAADIDEARTLSRLCAALAVFDLYEPSAQKPPAKSQPAPSSLLENA
jgi:hypothetical protein